jgi:hypothetical protein
MREVVILPYGWRKSLGECPVGVFEFNGHFGFKSQYGDCFCLDSGEMFWAGCHSVEDRNNLPVQPCIVEELDT